MSKITTDGVEYGDGNGSGSGYGDGDGSGTVMKCAAIVFDPIAHDWWHRSEGRES